MILIVVWDGLRPDMITPERTPFLARLAQGGAFCTASHAAFPSATRINSASLATGCYPGQHGLVDNELYVPELDANAPISCADWRALQQMADLEGQRLLSVPTLPEILRSAGRRFASAGSGSPGTTYLTNPIVAGPTVNWAVAWPQAVEAEMAQRLGGLLDDSSDSSARNTLVQRAICEVLLPQYHPDVLTLWLTEPDHAQHEHGLASPEALAMLREIDAQLQELVACLEALPGPEGLTGFLISDHGFDSIGPRPDPTAELVAAGFKASPSSTDIVRVSNSLYLDQGARQRLPELVAFLAERSWVGALFIRDDLLPLVPEAMPQNAVMGNHRRSAEIMFSYAWTTESNGAGVPGTVASPGRSMAATHGASSPYALNNTLVAWGARIKPGIRSDAPCGIVDIAPTVLHLLGLTPPGHMDGRILAELLQGGPAPEALAVTRSSREAVLRTPAGEATQVAHYSHVRGRTYLDQAAIKRD
jgi:arylsulfatase A-like enzyme